MFKSITPNLMTENIEETIEFYKSKLDFQIITSVPSENGKLVFVILAKDSTSLMFQLRENLIKEYPELEKNPIEPMLTLFIKVDDIQELYNRLESKVTIIKELHQTFYKTLEFAILDNNGNILTIAE